MDVDRDDATPDDAADVISLVRECWEDALLHGDFGDDDDFFDIGGHSLLIADIMSSLGSHLGHRIPLRVFFEHPTVNELGARLREPSGDERRDG
jgi:acyl carrier protein